jgi:DNA-directed RNA polymerase subunit RPC12/RpoP
MAEIVSLKAAREERQPHWLGTVQCVGCKQEWEAVAPIGTRWLECPACGLPKGHPKHPFAAAEGDLVLECAECGGEALTAYKRKGRMWVRCMGCGNDLTHAFYTG